MGEPYYEYRSEIVDLTYKFSIPKQVIKKYNSPLWTRNIRRFFGQAGFQARFLEENGSLVFLIKVEPNKRDEYEKTCKGIYNLVRDGSPGQNK